MPRYKLMAMGIGLGFFVYFFIDLVFLLGATLTCNDGWGPAIAICLTAGFLLDQKINFMRQFMHILDLRHSKILSHFMAITTITLVFFSRPYQLDL